MAFVPNDANPIGRNSASGNIIWVYHSTGDTLATIKAASYFSTTSKDFAVNDIIFVVGSDGCSMLCISAIDGGGNVTAPPVDIQADEVATSSLADIGQGTQNNVQEALADAYAAINLKIQSVLNIGSGSSMFSAIDATDPTDRTAEFRRLAGVDDITVTTAGGGDNLEVGADLALLRGVDSVGGGQSVVRDDNNAGRAELRSLLSSDGSLTFATSGGGTEVNIRTPSGLIVSGGGCTVNFAAGVFTISVP